MRGQCNDIHISSCRGRLRSTIPPIGNPRQGASVESKLGFALQLLPSSSTRADAIVFPGSAWFLRAEPQNWALHLCWFPLPIHAETLSHKLVIFCALVMTNTSPTSCLWDWWFLKWLIHSQGSGVKFTQKTLYSYVHKFKLGIQGFRSDQRVL